MGHTSSFLLSCPPEELISKEILIFTAADGLHRKVHKNYYMACNALTCEGEEDKEDDMMMMVIIIINSDPHSLC